MDIKVDTTKRHEAASHLKASISELPLLDLIRFLAAFDVALCHLRDVFFAPMSQTEGPKLIKLGFYAATRTGQEAVVLFFVLSGFLVGGSCIRQMANGSFSPGRYTVDRFSRIYVPLSLSLVFTFLVVIIFEKHHDLRQLAVNVVSLQGVFADPLEGNGALWSLSYEVWFYILAGAFCTLFVAKTFRSSLIAALIAIAGFLVFTKLDAAYLFSWLIGALTYCIPRTKGLIFIALLALVAVAGGTALMQLSIPTDQINVGSLSAIPPSLAMLACSASWALVIYVARYSTLPLGPKFRRFCTILAAFSYTLYLFHLPIQLILRRVGIIQVHDHLNAPNLALYLALGLLQVAFAYGLYWCAERHTGKVREWLYGVFNLRRPVPAAP